MWRLRWLTSCDAVSQTLLHTLQHPFFNLYFAPLEKPGERQVFQLFVCNPHIGNAADRVCEQTNGGLHRMPLPFINSSSQSPAGPT